MLKKRIIPILLLKNKGLVKGVKFSDYRYIGDPMNAIKVFNDKEVDEYKSIIRNVHGKINDIWGLHNKPL